MGGPDGSPHPPLIKRWGLVVAARSSLLRTRGRAVTYP